MDDGLPERLRARLAPLEVEPISRASVTYSANEDVLATHSVGLTRAAQALAAAADPSTTYAEYEYEDVRLSIGAVLIPAERRDFVLVLLATGMGDEAREIVAALRLYPKDHNEADAFLSDPTLALMTLIARYGSEYQIEAGKRSLFEPVVVFDRGRFTLPGRIEQQELLEALDLPTGLDDAYMMITAVRVLDSGEVKLFFPILLRSEEYAACVREARAAR